MVWTLRFGASCSAAQVSSKPRPPHLPPSFSPSSFTKLRRSPHVMPRRLLNRSMASWPPSSAARPRKIPTSESGSRVRTVANGARQSRSPTACQLAVRGIRAGTRYFSSRSAGRYCSSTRWVPARAPSGACSAPATTTAGACISNAAATAENRGRPLRRSMMARASVPFS